MLLRSGTSPEKCPLPSTTSGRRGCPCLGGSLWAPPECLSLSANPRKGLQWGSRKRIRKPLELRRTGGFKLALENNYFIKSEGTHLLFVRNVLYSQPQNRIVALSSHLQSLPSRYFCLSRNTTPSSVSLPPHLQAPF